MHNSRINSEIGESIVKNLITRGASQGGITSPPMTASRHQNTGNFRNKKDKNNSIRRRRSNHDK